jgi:hemerythrin
MTDFNSRTLRPGDAFEWNDSMLLGHGAMDDIHREFVELVQALRTCSPENALQRLDAVHAHALDHFEKERGWMLSTEFPPRDCHIDEHDAVLRSLAEVRALLADGRAGCALAIDLAEHLAAWFPGHADYLDSALAAWISKRTHGGKPVVLRRRIPATTEEPERPASPDRGA